MAKNKTTETTGSVTDFINKVSDETKRNDCLHIIKLMQKQTDLNYVVNDAYINISKLLCALISCLVMVMEKKSF